jgi:hypothetical protein
LVSNGTDSQVLPDPSGGPDVYEVTISSLGLGNLTLEFSEDAVGVLAVYGGTTSDSLEIGISQGGTQPFLCQLFLKLNPGHHFLSDRTPPRPPGRPTLLRRLDRKRGPPLLPALPPASVHTETDVPELHPPAREHQPPIPALVAQSHALPCAAGR